MKKWMRAILAALMLLMSFGLAACGDNDNKDDVYETNDNNHENHEDHDD